MVPSFLIYIKKRGKNMNTQEIMNQIKESIDSVTNIQELNNIKVDISTRYANCFIFRFHIKNF